MSGSPWDDLGLLDAVLADTDSASPREDWELRREETVAPLSRAQRRLWFLQQAAPASPAYNIFTAVRLSGRVDVAALRSAVSGVLRRHESLRSRFPVVEGRPELEIRPAWEIELPVEDVHSAELSRRAAEEARRPFDLESGPLLRVRLLRLAEREHVALLTLHHIVADGWSMGILVEELGRIYRNLVAGSAPALLEPAFRYSDFACWQQGWLEGESAAEQRRWWLERLADLSPLELPTDRPRPPEPSWRGGVYGFRVPDEAGARLRALAAREGATLYMALLGAFAVLLHRYTEQSDIVVGTPVANRHRRELESIVGLLVNSLVMRCDLSGDPTFIDVLRRVRDFAGEALARQDLPFDDLVKALASDRESGGNPLFQVMFNLESAALLGDLRLPDLTLTPLEVDSGVAKLDLLLTLSETDSGLLGGFEYAMDLFDPQTIGRMAGHLVGLIEAAAADPEAPVATLSMLSRDERRVLLWDWNRTATDYPADRCIHKLFEEQARLRPHAPAVECADGRRLSYGELAVRANGLAHRLRGLGVATGARVALLAERSLDVPIALLAILKAGGAYVPLSPEDPDERLAFLLREVAPAAVLVGSGLAARLPSGGWTVLPLEDDAYESVAQAPDVGEAPDRPAYVLYTSGSTGTPKGVCVSHGAVVRLVRATDYIRFGPDEVFLLLAPLAFDASTLEIWGPLLNGGRLAIAPPHRLSLPEISDCIRRYGVTTLWLTAGLFHLMVDECLEGLRPLRQLLAGGDVLSVPHVRRALDALEGCRIVNGYGPTEGTTFTCCYTVEEPGSLRGSVPIGRPIANTRVYILDRCMQPVPIGVPGELYIGGAGLALEYFGRPDLTAARFVANPLAEEPGPRLFRTGDLCRFLPDGNIEFLGRRDNQVKIRGFRIELGEIEAALLGHPGVREAVVLARADRPGFKRLVAYVVAVGDRTVAPDARGLGAFLEERLPEYMIPAAFVLLDALPLNRNGKVARSALPAPADDVEPDRIHEPPAGAREECLAAVLQGVLGGPPVGRHDDYFERGGDSITAIQVVSRLRRHGWQARVADLFRHPTVAQLAPRLVEEPAGVRTAEQSSGDGDVPLTPIQRWFFTQYQGPQRSHFNQAVLLKSAERLGETPLRRALAALLGRHDALRLRFTGERESLLQRCVAPREAAVDLTVIEIDASLDVSVELERHADALNAGIDIERGPLFRAGLLRCADADRLLLVIHHLAVDGVSWRILLEELELAYRQSATAAAVDPGTTGCSFRSWAQALTDFAATPQLAAETEYWTAVEQSAAGRLPTRLDGSAGMHGDAQSVHASLSPAATAELLGPAHRAFGTEVMDLLLVALGRALKGWSGSDAVHIALESHGREPFDESLDLTRTIGWLTALFPFLLKIPGDDLGEQIRTVRSALRAVPRKGLGYGVLRYLTRDSGLGLGSAPQLGFNYLGQFGDGGGSGGLLGFAEESGGRTIAPGLPRAHELEIVALVSGGRLLATLEHNPSGLERAAAAGLLQNFVGELEAVMRFCRDVATRPELPGETGVPAPLPGADLPAVGVVEDTYPLSPLQAGMLFQSLLDPQAESYFVQVRFQFLGRLDVDAFRDAWFALSRRHAVLRSTFMHRGLARPVQAVLRDRTPELAFHDIRHLDEAQRGVHLDAWCIDERRHTFDLERDTLLRVNVFREDAEAFHIVWSYHHILLDGWCLPIVERDLLELYAARLAGRAARLPPPVPYRRYIDWLGRRDDMAARRYWREYLEGYEELASVPRFGRAGEGQTRSLADETLVLDADTTAGLVRLAARAGATLSSVVRSLWGLLLSRYNDRDDVVFGAIVAGRPAELPGVEGMVGLFIAAVPVRVSARPDLPFVELVRAVQEAALAGEAHQFLSLADIQQESVLGSSLFDHMLIFENYPQRAVGGDPDSDAGGEFVLLAAYDPTHYDLDLTVSPGESLSVKLTYNTAVYDADQMQRTMGHLRTAATAVITDPAQPLREIPILPHWECRRLVDEFNATRSDYPVEQGLVELLEAQVARAPDAPALRCGEFAASYRALNAAANRLAHRLLDLGVGPGTTVGLCVARIPAMIVAPLAILKAGGIFVPLDPEYPSERLAFMLEDAGIAVLLIEARLSGQLPNRGARQLLLDEDGSSDGAWPDNDPPRRTGPGDTAYIIYTSGSTGRPKGVTVAHRGIANMAHAWRNAYRLGDFPVRLLQLASLSFDVFVGDLARALTNGGELVVCPAEVQLDPPSLYQLLADHRISIFESTPGLVLPLMEYIHANRLPLESLRLLIVGSDSLPARHFQTLVERFGERLRIVNSYGVTEATIDSSFFAADGSATLDPAGPTPIGKPLDNTRFYVLDRLVRLQPIGVPGELYIGGDGVAEGYLNQPELTAQRFLSEAIVAGDRWPAPEIVQRTDWGVGAAEARGSAGWGARTDALGVVPSEEGGRLYRTGDLARWLPDGNMELLGRIDSQVKVRGYRIEPGEVEERLLRLNAVKQALVLAREIDGTRELTAYVVADDRWDLRHARELLRQSLPAYMVPSFFVRLERLPLTPNGKIDWRALPDPRSAADRPAGQVPPRTALETALADIWREVLQLPTVGVHDDFFAVGGHSLKAMQIAGLIHRRFVVALPLREVFAHPTIAELAELVARGERSDWSHIPPAPQQAHYALSYAQQRLWMLHHMEGATAYNMPEAHLIEAEIDASVLERALQALVARHESLRTAFVSVEGEPRQQILTELPFSLAKLDLRASLDPQGEARAIVERDATQPFDLAGPPLLRASLVLLPEGRSLFALTLHHIVGDGWSGNILFRELLCLYEAFLHGRPDPLKPLRIQYKDFAAWQNARSFDAQERYWMARLCGMPERLDLPYDFAPGGLRDFSGGQESLDLDPAVAEGLRQLAARRRTTLSNVVLALFQLMLFHWTRQDDLCVGMSVANRSHPDLENLIGFFVNILPIRCTLSADMELDDLLRLVAARSQEALEHQDYPFDLMIRQLNPQRQANRQPLVNVIYGFQNFADVHVDVAPARPAVAPADATVDWQPFEFGFGTSKFDLTLFAWESEDGLRLHFEYDSTLFLAHTIRCQLETMQHFAGLIATSSHSS